MWGGHDLKACLKAALRCHLQSSTLLRLVLPAFPDCRAILVPAELFPPGHEASATGDGHAKQFPVLAGVRGHLRLRVSRRQGLPELLLLLRGMPVGLVEERAYPHRRLRTGLLLPGLLPHLLPALQPGLLGGIPVSLSAALKMTGEYLIYMFPFPHPQTRSDQPKRSREDTTQVCSVTLLAAWEVLRKYSL